MQVHALLRALRPHRRTLTLGDALLALPDYQVLPFSPCGALAAGRKTTPTRLRRLVSSDARVKGMGFKNDHSARALQPAERPPQQHPVVERNTREGSNTHTAAARARQLG